jgi:crotonobetainyl-CoA hydratase
MWDAEAHKPIARRYVVAKYGVDLTQMDTAIYERRGSVAIVTLNRPEALNSLNTAVHRDVGACYEEINTNDEIRAAVVTGAGRFFCAGRDIKEFVGQYGDGDTQALRPIDDPDNELFGQLINHAYLYKPLIVGLNGPVVGGGLELAIMADMVVMAEDAYAADLHAKVNVYGMDALNTFLPPMIAREVAMTERRLTAAECLRWGLANYVVPKDEVLVKSVELAEATARMGPDSIQRLKQGSIDLQLRSGNLWPPEFTEQRRSKIQAETAETAVDHDLMEGMRAFVEKRESEYERPVSGG